MARLVSTLERMQMSVRQSLFYFAAAAAIVALACPAAAGDVRTNSKIELGAIPRFADETSALAACQPDNVVWADAESGFYYPKFFTEYGKTQHGAYTCYRQAKKADYWNISPDYDGGHKGREFPLFFCEICS
jgi:hypothetical protein